jgi:hypothetical protein
MQSTIPIRIDSADLARLKDRMPDLSALDLPRLEVVGRTADDTIDRLLGRSSARVWPWVATGIGLFAVAGAIATYLWMRRPMTNPVGDEPVGESSIDASSTNGVYGELGSATGYEAPVAAE